jgi:hypothetical protein
VLVSSAFEHADAVPDIEAAVPDVTAVDAELPVELELALVAVVAVVEAEMVVYALARLKLKSFCCGANW